MSAPAYCSRCGVEAPRVVVEFFRSRQAPAADFYPPIGHHSGWNAGPDEDALGIPRAMLTCPQCSGPAETFRHAPATPQDVAGDDAAVVLNLRAQVGTLERQLADARELARRYQAIAADLRAELELSRREAGGGGS